MIITNPHDYFDFEQHDVFWMMNINQEQAWNTHAYFPSIADKRQMNLAAQQEQQLIFLARNNDMVLLRHRIDDEFIAYLKEKGVNLPNVAYTGDQDLAFWLQQSSRALLVPYISTEEIEEIQRKLPCVKVYGSNPQLSKLLNHKSKVRQLMIDHHIPVTQGFFCSDTDQLWKAYEELSNAGFDKCVTKIPYGSSGKGLRVISSKPQLKSLVSFITKRGQAIDMLIEGWHKAQQLLNSQIIITEDSYHLIAVTEQRIDNQGMYLGTNYTPAISSETLQEYTDYISRLCVILREMGYRGIAGIDSIVDEYGAIYPVIEINARFTQVTYLLPLIMRVSQQYKFIESRFIRLEFSERYSFAQMEAWIRNELKLGDDSDFLLYTFAKESPDQSTSTYSYRIFCLLFANDRIALDNMIKTFQDLESNKRR